ncbi:MAG: HAD hydrolase-like protein [Cyanobacteria bacterium P01_D01_bin.36]
MSVWNPLIKAVAATSHQNASAQQVVFCDFDGPIVDVSERYYHTYRRGLVELSLVYRQANCAELSITPLSKQDFWHQKQNRVADKELAACSGVPEDWFQRYMKQVEQLVNHPSLLRWDQIQPSAKTALIHLKQTNMRLVLVTLRHPHQVKNILQTKGLGHLVDDIYGASAVNAAHHNRVNQKCELLEHALEQQAKQGHRVLGSWMIGDTEADILAAQTLGLRSAALSCGVRSKNYLEALGPTSLYNELLEAVQFIADNRTWQAA